MKTLLLPAFIIIALVQWFVPGKMLFDRETVLKKGQTFRFLTEPIDPNNPFIGKYVSLNFKEESVTVAAPENWHSDQDIYVLLKNDDSGFARIKSISAKKPQTENGYVKARLRNIYDSTLIIDYPFDEFYMEESKAPKAEKAYWDANRDTASKTWAVVKVWKGTAVTDNVMINNKPILEYIR